jgi:ABC-type polysaccharide/polyol phosphate export permease
MMVASKLSPDVERYRDLYTNLVRTELTVRYKTTVLGTLWFLLNPLLLTTILTVVFQHFVRLEIPNYAFFVLSGLLPWTLFQEGLNGSSSSITRSAALVKRSRVPRVLLVLATIGASTMHFLVSLAVLFGLMAIARIPPTSNVLLLPAAMLVQVCCLTGLGLAAASLNVLYRDVEHVLTLGLRLGFYLTPVFYPLDYVPEAWRGVYLINPMVSIIEIYRHALIGGHAVPPQMWLTAGVTSLVVLGAGVWTFRQLEPAFDDHV